MSKMISKKEKLIYGIFFLIGVILLIWSGWRNTSCGYDCGLFNVNIGPVVIVSLLFSLILISGSVALPFIIFIFRKYVNGK